MMTVKLRNMEFALALTEISLHSMPKIQNDLWKNSLRNILNWKKQDFNMWQTEKKIELFFCQWN